MRAVSARASTPANKRVQDIPVRRGIGVICILLGVGTLLGLLGVPEGKTYWYVSSGGARADDSCGRTFFGRAC